MLKFCKRKLNLKIRTLHTPLTETIQVLELGSGYKILTINTTFYDDFFSFFKQTATTEPTHGVK